MIFGLPNSATSAKLTETLSTNLIEFIANKCKTHRYCYILEARIIKVTDFKVIELVSLELLIRASTTTACVTCPLGHLREPTQTEELCDEDCYSNYCYNN